MCTDVVHLFGVTSKAIQSMKGMLLFFICCFYIAHRDVLEGGDSGRGREREKERDREGRDREKDRENERNIVSERVKTCLTLSLSSDEVSRQKDSVDTRTQYRVQILSMLTEELVQSERWIFSALHILKETEPTQVGKQPIRSRYLGHVTGCQPISDQYFLIRSVPG
eukprot:sb/3472426/